MKNFFEQYGGITLGILAVLVLIAMVSPVGGKIKESLTGVTKGFDNKMTNGLNNSGFGFGGSTGGSGGGSSRDEISGVTTGKVLTIEGKDYTVIEQVEGSKYKVLATDLANKGGTMQFGSTNEYKTSTIATYLDSDYYKSLPESIKNAIVETSIQQKVSSTGYDNGKNSPTWTGETKDAGTHKVFLPSWEELTKAAGDTTPTTLQTFVNGKYVWLRDTYSSVVLYVYSGGNLGDYGSPNNVNFCVRPAFVLDLSKVTYTVK